MTATEQFFIHDEQCAFSPDEAGRMQQEIGIRVVQSMMQQTILDHINDISERIAGLDATSDPDEIARLIQERRALAMQLPEIGY